MMEFHMRVQERKAVLDAYHLTAEQYSRNQLACDLRNRILRLLNTEPLNTEHSKLPGEWLQEKMIQVL
jgi:hypothetical protein